MNRQSHRPSIRRGVAGVLSLAAIAVTVLTGAAPSAASSPDAAVSRRMRPRRGAGNTATGP